ncbi:hypothetical protein MRX96_050534 [Rhipicephalus microplus]
MSHILSLSSAIVAAVILQAVFIGLSRPDSAHESTTTEAGIQVEYCNETCTQNTSCSNDSCFCVRKNNSFSGYCFTLFGDDIDYNETLPDISNATPRYFSK